MEAYYFAIDLLKGMILRPSFSREETDVADFLQEQWQTAGHEVSRKGNNLWIKDENFDSGKPTLLLNSHIDTAKQVSGWTKNPFAPLEEDERLYGLGSNDAGASLVSLYAAFTILSSKSQPYNLILAASAEEEVSGKEGIENLLPELPPVMFGVVGEPTDMRPVIAEKGLLALDCTGHDKAGHPFLQRASMLGKEPLESPRLSDQALIPFPTVNIGPGDPTRSHIADEYIDLPEIREAIELYIRLLDQLKIK